MGAGSVLRSCRSVDDLSGGDLCGSRWSEWWPPVLWPGVLGLAGPASAGSAPGSSASASPAAVGASDVSAQGTAPACIKRTVAPGYAKLKNNCGRYMWVKVIIKAGPDSPCYPMRPGGTVHDIWTVGWYDRTVTC
ncbi:hypothetical protein [Streptomyces venezuelae]|uniref:hypothetical protein n=1 Tax=Streptomyces venezuelae TaxID=54571 RepID=UPI0037994F0B